MNEEIAAMDEFTAFLNNIQENIDDKTWHEDLANELETIRSLETEIKIYLSEVISYKYFKYGKGEVTVKDIYKLGGHLLQQERKVTLYEPKQHDGMSPEQQVIRANLSRKDSASQFRCEVIRSCQTKFNRIDNIFPLDDDNAVVCVLHEGQWKLYRLNFRHGKVLDSVTLKDKVDGMAVVILAGKPYVAVSHEVSSKLFLLNKPKINFHSADKLQDIVHSMSMELNSARSLYTSLPSTVLFVDEQNIPPQVRFLDCSKKPPKPVACSLQLQRCYTSDMIYAENNNKKLLIAVHHDTSKRTSSAIFAYNMDENRLEWMVKGKLGDLEKYMNAWGVTTDGCGHLFVSDTSNACVQVFSVDGVYTRTLLRGERGLGNPIWIRWCKNTSSLIVVHKNAKLTLCLVCVRRKMYSWIQLVGLEITYT